MSKGEHPLQQWLAGTSTGSGRQQVVLQSRSLLARVTSGQLISPDVQLYRPAAPVDRYGLAQPRSTEFVGDFLAADGVMLLAGGYRSRLVHYGSAEFAGLDLPTVLRIFDGDDFSAFLRDADQAWGTGTFADHVTHPNVTISDVAGLGGPFQRAGPDDRVFVFGDGRISTSPTGRVIGNVDDTLADIRSRWQRLNEANLFPDAVCLDEVVPGSDRVDALLERPWIRRYLGAVSVVRSARRTGPSPTKVSGFGSRITPGLGRPDFADDLGAPLLLQFGSGPRAYDAVGPGRLDLTPEAAAALEVTQESSSLQEIRSRCESMALSRSARADDLIIGLLQRLSLARVAPSWCGRTQIALLAGR